jgi:hypothetical protein
MLRTSMTEVDMTDTLKSKIEKIKHPQNYYETPDALTKDPELSFEEKKKALDVWEQDARQMLTAATRVCRVAKKASAKAITLSSVKLNAQRISCATSQNAMPLAEAAKCVVFYALRTPHTGVRDLATVRPAPILSSL